MPTAKNNVVMTVGVQSMADPTWLKANELIRAGKIGHVAQAQTSYYRNSSVGQWRYYRLYKEMNPETINWDMFLGHDFEVMKGVPLGPTAKDQPFDRAVFGQWRCYWPFGGGMFTDLFVHQTTHMISAMGVRYPGRVVAGGGLYLEYDGRDVPDVTAITADYDEGCQLMVTATMINAYPIEELIRGHLGTIKFVAGGFQIIKDDPTGAAAKPARLEKSLEPDETVEAKIDGYTREDWGNNFDTAALWGHFLECVRGGKRETLCPPELGAAAFTTVAMGVKSYREGKAFFWDKEARKPVEADASWASRWRSAARSTASRMRSPATWAARTAANCSRRITRSWPARGSTARTRPRAESRCEKASGIFSRPKRFQTRLFSQVVVATGAHGQGSNGRGEGPRRRSHPSRPVHAPDGASLGAS